MFKVFDDEIVTKQSTQPCGSGGYFSGNGMPAIFNVGVGVPGKMSEMVALI
jgi:hypothetical protein